MRRKVVIGALVAAVAAIVAVAVGCGSGDDGGYKVRAIFHNAFTLIEGEDVKVAGVTVGRIDEIELEGDKAAVVLDITEPGFQDFRQDATCMIRPQSLIGERFVECTLTEPRAEGERPAPPLKKIEDGPGKGQYLLPASNTVNPVDVDLVTNIYQLPVRQRLSLILNELGTGLAGNGKALREAIRSANPALRETDKVLALIAEQNDALRELVDAGDRVLAPLAANRRSVANFIDKANTTAQATAERRGELEESIRRLPAFLRQLKPTMERLGQFADQAIPVAGDLNSAGDDISRFIKGLGAFAEAGIPATEELGETALVARRTLLASKPLLDEARTFARDARPLVKSVADLLVSFRDTGGVERFMDFIYFSVASTNGFDEDGHYLRASAVVNTCLGYATTESVSCSANFQDDEDESSGSASAASRVVARNLDGSRATAKKADRIELPAAVLPGAKAGGKKSKTATTKRVADEVSGRAAVAADPSAALLDYLLGD